MALRELNDVRTKTPIYRMIHIDNLDTLLRRNALHAPGCIPNDGFTYTGIHALQTQIDRGDIRVSCGPGGTIMDYIGFYFGPRSPMLYRIHTGYNVQQIDQKNIIYLVSTAQIIADAGLGFVFTDRHSLARVADFRDSLNDLDIVDFSIVYAEQWNTTPQHLDRQEKKQAEFLVYQSMPWNLIKGIGVLNEVVKESVMQILINHTACNQPTVLQKPSWYY